MPIFHIKSAAIAAALFASPAAAQIGNWDINYQSLTTNFTYGVTDEIELEYHIGTGRGSYNIDLFDKGCVDSITGITIVPTNVVTPDVTADHDQLDVKLNLDRSAIAASSIWSGAQPEYIDAETKWIELCVVVQLLSGADVIKEDKRDVEVAFDFLVDVSVENVALTTPNLSPQLQSDTAGIDSYISACKCDDFDSFSCDASPLAPDDVLNVCISSEDAEVEIQIVSNFDLFQGDAVANETLDVIRTFTLLNPSISSLTNKSDTQWMVATVVPSRFFQSAGATLSASGEVQVNFARRLEAKDTGTSNRRSVRSEGISVARGYLDQEDAASEPTAANFELTIALADAPTSDILAPATSGNNDSVDGMNNGSASAVGIPLLFGTVVYFGWAFLF